MKKDSKQRLFEMMGKVDSSFKNKLNENEEKFSTVEKTKRGMTYLFAYPDKQGIETRDGLEDWEAKDRPNRELQFVGDKQKAENALKSMVNENIYVDDNAPQLLDYIIEYLPKVTNIAIKDPNSSSQWDGFFMRDVNFKNSDYDNAYFYYETSGVGHDEEGQRAFGEPKSGVIAVPFSVMVDIDNSYADTNGSTLIINSDLQDEIKNETGLEENTLSEDSPFPVQGKNKYIDNHERYGGRLAATEIDLIIDYLEFRIQSGEYEEGDYELKKYSELINQLEMVSNELI